MKHGKKYNESVKLFDKQKLYDPEEGLEVVISTGKAKFDETVEAHIHSLLRDRRHEFAFAADVRGVAKDR